MYRCGHGRLFVTSFLGHAHGKRRIIHKLGIDMLYPPLEFRARLLCSITLPDDYTPECLTCPRGDRLYVTAHRPNTEISSDGAVFCFPCGCEAAGGHAEVPQATRVTSDRLAGPHYITTLG